jgi:hypothetical protein
VQPVGVALLGLRAGFDNLSHAFDQILRDVLTAYYRPMTVSRPRRAGGRTHLEIVPDQLVWALYGRESLDPKGTAVQVANQLADLRPFALGIGGRIGREYPENNVSAFKRVKVLLPDGTYGYVCHERREEL